MNKYIKKYLGQNLVLYFKTMNEELELWIKDELKSKDMKKYKRKIAHVKYLEKRITELRDSYMQYDYFRDKFFEKDLTELKIKSELFVKYNERLKKF